VTAASQVAEKAYRWPRTLIFAVTLALVISLPVLLWLLA
jgi:hypothetical protein